MNQEKGEDATKITWNKNRDAAGARWVLSRSSEGAIITLATNSFPDGLELKTFIRIGRPLTLQQLAAALPRIIECMRDEGRDKLYARTGNRDLAALMDRWGAKTETLLGIPVTKVYLIAEKATAALRILTLEQLEKAYEDLKNRGMNI